MTAKAKDGNQEEQVSTDRQPKQILPGMTDSVGAMRDMHDNSEDVKSSLNPDYKFLCRYTKKEFYVECKARDIKKLLKKTVNFLDEQDRLFDLDKEKLKKYEEENKYLQLLDLSSPDQFKRFKELNKSTKVVFMILLITDHKIRDDVISLIPIDDLLSHKVFYSQILNYQIADTLVDPVPFWRKFLYFYGHPGYCIRCNDKIKYNNYNPFCYTCWENWNQYGKFNYEEKWCHACGREHSTTSVKPLCFSCFKKFPLNVGL